MSDQEAEKEFNETENQMAEEEPVMKKADKIWERIDKLEDKVNSEIGEEWRKITAEGGNEKEQENPANSADIHKEIISEEDHTKKLLEEIVDEIEEEVKKEIEEGELLVNEDKNLEKGIKEILKDLQRIGRNLQEDKVTDQQLEELIDIMNQIEEAVELEYRSKKELEHLEKQMRNTEVEIERAENLLQESINEERTEEREIDFARKRAEQYGEKEVEEKLAAEEDHLVNLEEEDKALAQAIVSEVNSKLQVLAKDIRFDLKESRDFLEHMEDDILKLLTNIDKELMKQKEEDIVDEDKAEKISQVQAKIRDFRPEIENKLSEEQSIIEDEEEMGSKLYSKLDDIKPDTSPSKHSSKAKTLIIVLSIILIFAYIQGVI